MDNCEKEKRNRRIEILMKQYEELYGYDHVISNFNYFYDKASDEEYTVNIEALGN